MSSPYGGRGPSPSTTSKSTANFPWSCVAGVQFHWSWQCPCKVLAKGVCPPHFWLPPPFWGLNPHTWWQISVAYNWRALSDEWSPTGQRGKVWQSDAVSLLQTIPQQRPLQMNVSRCGVSRRAERFGLLAGWQKAQVHLGAQPAPVMF